MTSHGRFPRRAIARGPRVTIGTQQKLDRVFLLRLARSDQVLRVAEAGNEVVIAGSPFDGGFDLLGSFEFDH